MQLTLQVPLATIHALNSYIYSLEELTEYLHKNTYLSQLLKLILSRALSGSLATATACLDRADDAIKVICATPLKACQGH